MKDYLRLQYNNEQNLLVKNTKKQLTNNIKTKIIKKQEEWKEIFEKYKDINNNDLKNFFEQHYNSIDDYTYQILECIKQYDGNDIESLQKKYSSKSLISRIKSLFK